MDKYIKYKIEKKYLVHLNEVPKPDRGKHMVQRFDRFERQKFQPGPFKHLKYYKLQHR